MGYRASCFGWVTLPVVDNYHAACCGWSRCEGNRKRAFFQPLRSSSATSCAGISSFSHESTRFVHAKAVLIRFPNLWLYIYENIRCTKEERLFISKRLFVFCFFRGRAQNSLAVFETPYIYKPFLSQYISYPYLKATQNHIWWVSSRDLSFLCQNSPSFCFWSLLPVLLLWLQPGNLNLEQAACILLKVTVPFSLQDLILAVTCLDQANANLLSDVCFMYIVHGMFLI